MRFRVNGIKYTIIDAKRGTKCNPRNDLGGMQQGSLFACFDNEKIKTGLKPVFKKA